VQFALKAIKKIKGLTKQKNKIIIKTGGKEVNEYNL
jgi:hypothetical protein